MVDVARLGIRPENKNTAIFFWKSENRFMALEDKEKISWSMHKMILSEEDEFKYKVLSHTL